MPSLGTLKSIAAVVALCAAVAGLAGLVAHWRSLEARSAAYAACSASAAGKAALGPTVCDKQISAGLDLAARARACDADLSAGEGRAWAALRSCSAPVAHVIAERDARADEVVDRDQLITRLKAESSAAVARAEARALTVERNRRNADAAIAAAPRLPDGRLSCDADCLRHLAGSAGP